MFRCVGIKTNMQSKLAVLEGQILKETIQAAYRMFEQYAKVPVQFKWEEFYERYWKINGHLQR